MKTQIKKLEKLLKAIEDVQQLHGREAEITRQVDWNAQMPNGVCRIFKSE